MQESFISGRNIFSLVFPTGEKILFTCLPYKDWLAYQRLMKLNLINFTLLEEDIFNRCLVNSDVYPLASGLWPAGIISTVVSVVLRLSGNPLQAEEDKQRFNLELSLARERLKEVDNTTTMLICKAFPAYTPEEVDSLDWDKRLLRLVQSEEILMRTGFISQPINLINPEDKMSPSQSLSKQITQDQMKPDLEFLSNEIEDELNLKKRRDLVLQRLQQAKQKKR